MIRGDTSFPGPSHCRKVRHSRQRRCVFAAILVVAAPFLSGCAELMVASSAATLAKALSPHEPQWVEVSQLTFAYPVDTVYMLLLQVVERNDRRIVERTAESHALMASYPFSWLKNNWGGSLKITCAPNESGTTVSFEGDGRDTLQHVRAIGDEVLADLDRELRRQPRAL